MSGSPDNRLRVRDPRKNNFVSSAHKCLDKCHFVPVLRGHLRPLLIWTHLVFEPPLLATKHLLSSHFSKMRKGLFPQNFSKMKQRSRRYSVLKQPKYDTGPTAASHLANLNITVTSGDFFSASITSTILCFSQNLEFENGPRTKPPLVGHVCRTLLMLFGVSVKRVYSVADLAKVVILKCPQISSFQTLTISACWGRTSLSCHRGTTSGGWMVRLSGGTVPEPPRPRTSGGGRNQTVGSVQEDNGCRKSLKGFIGQM